MGQTLVCPAPEPAARGPHPAGSSSPELLIQTAGLRRQSLPPPGSLLCSPGGACWIPVPLPLLGLIRPGHNFLMLRPPPPSDWEFLWGWGQGTEPFSRLGPSTRSGPEDTWSGLVRWKREWLGGCLVPQPSDVCRAEADGSMVTYLSPLVPQLLWGQTEGNKPVQGLNKCQNYRLQVTSFLWVTLSKSLHFSV